MKGFIVTVTAKGQFTLPRAARVAMGVRPGDRIEMFVSRDGETILRAMNKPPSAIFGRGKAYGTGVPEQTGPMADVAEAIAAKGRPASETPKRRSRARKAG